MSDAAAPRAHATGPLFTRRTAAALGAILFLGLVLRLVLLSRAPAFVIPVDSGEFYQAAYGLVTEGQFPLPVKRAPGYPFLLAFSIGTAGPSLESAAAWQHALGLIGVVLAYCVGALAFGRAAGLLAALGVSINGGLLLIEHSIMSEAFFAPLLLAHLTLLLLGLRSGRPWLFLTAGLVLGLTALTRSAAQAILPLGLAAVVLALPDWRRRVLAAALLVVGFTVVVGPWMLRNRAVHGVTAISSGLGDALFARTHRHDQSFDFRDRSKVRLENREQARIRNRVFELARDYRFSREVREALQAEFGVTPLQADAALRDASLQVIRQEPQRYVLGTLEMFRVVLPGFEKPLDEFWETRTKPKYIRDWPETLRFALSPADRWTDADEAVVDAVTSVYEDHRLGPLFVALLVAGALRSLGGWRRGAWLLPAVFVSQLLLYLALDGPLFRYRAQLQPLLTLVAAGGATWLAALLWPRVRSLRLADRPARETRLADPGPAAPRAANLP